MLHIYHAKQDNIKQNAYIIFLWLNIKYFLSCFANEIILGFICYQLSLLSSQVFPNLLVRN